MAKFRVSQLVATNHAEPLTEHGAAEMTHIPCGGLIAVFIDGRRVAESHPAFTATLNTLHDGKRCTCDLTR